MLMKKMPIEYAPLFPPPSSNKWTRKKERKNTTLRWLPEQHLKQKKRDQRNRNPKSEFGARYLSPPSFQSLEFATSKGIPLLANHQNSLCGLKKDDSSFWKTLSCEGSPTYASLDYLSRTKKKEKRKKKEKKKKQKTIWRKTIWKKKTIEKEKIKFNHFLLKKAASQFKSYVFLGFHTFSFSPFSHNCPPSACK